MNIPQDLQPGDWLGYHHKGNPLAEVIYLRTGGLATHSAVYHGGGHVITSLAGGVNLYPMDPDGLVIVRRPQSPFLLESADRQFNEHMKGLPYGIWDCLKDQFPDRHFERDELFALFGAILSLWEPVLVRLRLRP
jgi:hypothetical protein